MKKSYFLIATFLLTIVSISFGQDREAFKNNYQPIRTELQNWDAIRGDWLASSIEAMSFNEPIPDRPFPENFTPNQMMRMVPAATRTNIINQANSVTPDARNKQQWEKVRRFSRISNCNVMSQARSGRSYGDPHLVSFDGERFSFQTVGEFVMTKSQSQNMEVQVRQRAQGNEVSLNSAVAMNVGGDRLCIYAKDYPDADYSTPVRLNGMSLNLQGSTYFLPHGGTIRKSNNDYTVYFPSGETVVVDMRRDFMNVNVKVALCEVFDYTGLLGNANGDRRDDFNVRGMVAPSMAGFGTDSDYFKRERQAFLAKDFAEEHRVTQMTSLFDYRIGTSTLTYTDRSYPRVYRDLNGLSQRQRDRARRTCQSAGVGRADMNGCIYDNAYLNIGPSKPTVVRDPTQGTVLRPISKPTPNVNPNPPRPPKPKPLPVKQEEFKKGESQGSGTVQPISKPSSSSNKNDHEIKKGTSTSTPKPRTTPRPVRTTPRPVVTPRPTPKPRPVYKPRPTRTTPKPRPAPKPTPRPKPTVRRIGGR